MAWGYTFGIKIDSRSQNEFRKNWFWSWKLMLHLLDWTIWKFGNNELKWGYKKITWDIQC
jgi:hypothetical protein